LSFWRALIAPAARRYDPALQSLRDSGAGHHEWNSAYRAASSRTGRLRAGHAHYLVGRSERRGLLTDPPSGQLQQGAEKRGGLPAPQAQVWKQALYAGPD